MRTWDSSTIFPAINLPPSSRQSSLYTVAKYLNLINYRVLDYLEWASSLLGSREFAVKIHNKSQEITRLEVQQLLIVAMVKTYKPFLFLFFLLLLELQLQRVNAIISFLVHFILVFAINSFCASAAASPSKDDVQFSSSHWNTLVMKKEDVSRKWLWKVLLITF